VAIEGVEPEALLMSLGDLAVSGGSACSSASAEPSHVLKAIGLSDDLARASIRIGLGRFTTDAEIDFAAAKLVQVIRHLRERSTKLGIA
jgi:cysteine desulfurase